MLAVFLVGCEQRFRKAPDATFPSWTSAPLGGRGRSAWRLTLGERAELSLPPGTPDHRLYAWRVGRYHRPPDGAVAFGAARPTVRGREPARRRHQSRHRGGRECAARRLHAPARRARKCDQRLAVREA